MTGAKNRAGLQVQVFVGMWVQLQGARCKVMVARCTVAKCLEHSQPFQVGHRPQCQAVTLVLRLHTKDYDIKAGEKVRKKSKANARQMRCGQ